MLLLKIAIIFKINFLIIFVKNNVMKLKLLFMFFVVQIAFAQQRTCGMQEKMQHIMADPILKQQYLLL